MDRRIKAITGMNLGMILESAVLKDDAELCESLVCVGITEVATPNLQLTSKSEKDE